MATGQRFEITLEERSLESTDPTDNGNTFDVVGDIQERATKAPVAPSFPSAKHSTGFPAHTKRKFNADKTNQRGNSRLSGQGPVPVVGDGAVPSRNAAAATRNSEHSGGDDLASQERRQIHLENEQILAAMSQDEIQEARDEILGALDPLLLQRILKRSDINSGSNEATSLNDVPSATHITRAPLSAGQTVALDDDDISLSQPEDAEATNTSNTEAQPLPQSIHFPRAPQPPDLDPASSTFLDDLHSKYFPALPADPEKLEWMRESTDAKSSYDPAQAALNPGDIRFDFKGSLIPPSRALHIPVSAGLHHHGDAPDAAGYTIPELAHLSRSTYAPQRCIAFQTLGRILFRLGRGEFGDPGEPKRAVDSQNTFGELARGLWQEVESQHVIEQLVAESEGNGVDGGRHVSAKAYATEAVWLWQKGGGRRWKTS